jgi:hypothetical protein
MKFDPSMKTIAGISLLLIFCTFSPKLTSAKEYEVSFHIEDIYDYELIDHLFDTDENLLIAPNKRTGTKLIVIVDQNGNKIREERIRESEGFCTTGTLLPLIYKCALITEIDGVCYFLLNKNNR